MTSHDAQAKFSAAFCEALTEMAQAAGLGVREYNTRTWLEEPFESGSKGWWVHAALRSLADDDERYGRVPQSELPVRLSVAYLAGDDEPSTYLLDVSIEGAGAHLVRPLAAMAVGVVAAWLRDRDTRIESLREQKAKLAGELERVTAELFELDGISD